MGSGGGAIGPEQQGQDRLDSKKAGEGGAVLQSRRAAVLPPESGPAPGGGGNPPRVISGPHRKWRSVGGGMAQVAELLLLLAAAAGTGAAALPARDPAALEAAHFALQAYNAAAERSGPPARLGALRGARAQVGWAGVAFPRCPWGLRGLEGSVQPGAARCEERRAEPKGSFCVATERDRRLETHALVHLYRCRDIHVHLCVYRYMEI